MKKIIYFIALLATVFPQPSMGYMEGAGFFKLSNYSSSSSSRPAAAEVVETSAEVTRAAPEESSPRPEERPQPKMTAASATTPAPKETKPGSALNPKYSLTPKGTKANLGEPLSVLKSCDQIKMITGEKPKRSSKEGPCGDVTIAQSFAPILMKQLPICVAEGAKAAGFSQNIKKVNIYNAGAHVKKKTEGKSRWSLHSTGNAFDIYQIDVQSNQGDWLKVPMTVASKNHPFYKTFNSCWAKYMASTNRCKYDGNIDCKDPNHRGSIHLSKPYCPRKPGYMTL